MRCLVLGALASLLLAACSSNDSGGGSGGGGGASSDPFALTRSDCVDRINQFRSTLGLPAYARWTDAESCVDKQARSDGQTGTPHGAFGQCGEFAQDECPGYPDTQSVLGTCLDQMWAEGPGTDFKTHGHYINMSSTQYSKVACGFAQGKNGLWAAQDFK